MARSSLTANCGPQPPPPALADLPGHTPPRPAGTTRRQRGEQGGRSEGLHEGLAPEGWRGAGEECAPPVGGWPPRTGTTRQPPRDLRGAAPGDQKGGCKEPPSIPSPPPPPGPRTAGGRPGRWRPHTPPRGPPHQGGGRHSRGGRSRAPSAPTRPPTRFCSARCRLAALRWPSRAPHGPQRNGNAQECSMEGGRQTKRPASLPARERRANRPQQRDLPAPRPAGPPGRAPGGTAHWHPPPAPPG